MAKLTFDTGNFSLAIEGTPSQAVADRLIENGLRYEVQREVASSVYTEIAGEPNKEGKKRLPKGFERSSLEYDESNAAAFEEAASKALSKFGDFTVSVTKYEGSEAASPMKRATALVDSFIGTEMEAAYRGILGLPKGNRDDLIAEANKRGLGIQPPKAAKTE